MLGLNKKQLSDGCYVASLVSVAVSIATWVLISPEDPAHGERFALFIGLWAPTLMGLANYYKTKEQQMNAVEFLFALFAVFGSTGLWLAWTSFVYKLDNFSEEKKSKLENKEDVITNQVITFY